MATLPAQRRTVIGLVLLGLGVLSFIANAQSWPVLLRIPLALLLLAGGGLLVRRGIQRKRRRGITLTGGGVLLVTGATLLSEDFLGAIVLALLGSGFVWVYLDNHKRWWALLPGGLFLTLATIVGLDLLFPRLDTSPILFLGFAATFTVIYLLPSHAGGRRWALYPALFWILIAILNNDPIGQPLSALLPFILIASGGFLLWRAWERGQRNS